MSYWRTEREKIKKLIVELATEAGLCDDWQSAESGARQAVDESDESPGRGKGVRDKAKELLAAMDQVVHDIEFYGGIL